VRFREAVLEIRQKKGTFEFRRDPESYTLCVHVELPIPGVTGMAAFATCPVTDEASDESRAEATVKCYRACRSKLMTLNPPPTPERIEDGEILAAMGIRW
jgi:hypothetical protein